MEYEMQSQFWSVRRNIPGDDFRWFKLKPRLITAVRKTTTRKNVIKYFVGGVLRFFPLVVWAVDGSFRSWEPWIAGFTLSDSCISKSACSKNEFVHRTPRHYLLILEFALLAALGDALFPVYKSLAKKPIKLSHFVTRVRFWCPMTG